MHTYTSVVIQTHICMRHLCTKLVHSSPSCISLHSQHGLEGDPSKTHLQLGEQCQLLPWKPHHCCSLCPTYWQRRCSHSDGQRVRKAGSTPWSSHWPYVKPFHSLLPLKLICSIQTSSLELFGEDIFLIIYLLKNREALFSVGLYADLLPSCWSDIFT